MITRFIPGTDEKISVELEDIGEGRSGDYDPCDPYDIPLMRFSFYRGDEQVDNGSYCTLIHADIEPEMQTAIEQLLMDEFLFMLERGDSIKKKAERFAWMKLMKCSRDLRDGMTGGPWPSTGFFPLE